MTSELPDVIADYFEADAGRDVDAIVALFDADAVVVDEGETRRGVDEIRAWQEGPASAYTYTTEVLSSERLGDNEYEVTGRLDGNFPGGTVVLRWRFTIVGTSIRRLVIAP